MPTPKTFLIRPDEISHARTTQSSEVETTQFAFGQTKDLTALEWPSKVNAEALSFHNMIVESADAVKKRLRSPGTNSTS